jgi:hypothetical protein
MKFASSIPQYGGIVQAFACKKGDVMAREKACKIW